MDKIDNSITSYNHGLSIIERKSIIITGVKTAVVKCGEKGCIIGDANGIYSVPAVPVEKCVDTTGAGDTFVSCFLWALSEGLELLECGKFACAAASFAVESVGATDGICSLEEIRGRMEKHL